jgi:hypothetical protein
MAKYILVSVAGRMFAPPLFFDTHQEAYAQMKKELLEYIILYACVKGSDYDIYKDSAWAKLPARKNWGIYALP